MVKSLIQIWNIILLGVFLNIIAAIDAPLRQATFIYLVDDDSDLGNAISLNASCFNIARLMGPALAGLIIAHLDVKACFFINFLCLIPSVFLVSRMNIKEKKYTAIQNVTIFEGVKEGLCYIFKNYQINILLRFKSVFSFIVLTHPVLIPIYSKDVLNSDADVLGLLMSMAGIGAFCSSLYFAGRTSARGLKKFLFTGTVLVGISFIALGTVHSIPFDVIFMLGVGIGMNAYSTPNNLLLQRVVDDDKRGRVMSINALCYLGTTSISSFVAGSIAEFFGIAQTFIILGCILFLVAVYFGFKLYNVNFIKKEIDKPGNINGK